MHTLSFSPLRRRNLLAAVTATLAFALPSFVSLGAQQPATAKPGAAATAKPTAAQPATPKPATAQPAKEKSASKPAAATGASQSTLVDINHATVKQLKSVPGIGDSYAAKIIAGRPYANKTQLVSRNIINASLFETIQGMIIAKQ